MWSLTYYDADVGGSGGGSSGGEVVVIFHVLIRGISLIDSALRSWITLSDFVETPNFNLRVIIRYFLPVYDVGVQRVRFLHGYRTGTTRHCIRVQPKHRRGFQSGSMCPRG